MTSATALLADFSPGETSSTFSEFAGSNELLYLDANESEIWVTDGTAKGTKKIADGDRPSDFILESSGLSFFEVLTADGSAIWRSDGTPDGTFALLRGRSLQPELDFQGVVVRSPQISTASGFHYFTVHFEGRWELYRTDGTSENTVLVSANVQEFGLTTQAVFYLEATEEGQSFSLLLHQSALPEPVPIDVDFERVRSLEMVADKLLFFVDDREDWSTPWISDGTKAGTFELSADKVRSFRRISGANVNGVHVYIVPVHGVFRTDGTREGTYPIDTSIGWPFAGFLGMGEDLAYFIASEQNRFTIVATDGTKAVEEFSLSFTVPQLIDGQLTFYSREDPLPHYFSVFDERLGITNFPSPKPSINFEAVRVGQYWYYSSEEWEPQSGQPETFYHRIELGDQDSATPMETLGGRMLTRNTSTLVDGTRAIKGVEDPLFTIAGGHLSAFDGGLVPRPVAMIENLGPMHYGEDGFYFVSDSVESGVEIWRSDGTSEGTDVVDLFPGATSSNPELIHWGGKTLAVADVPGVGRELWRIGSVQPGDTNGDFKVDFADFLVLSQNFGREVEGPSMGDFNEDGVVTFADFLLLSQQFQAN